MSGKFAQQVALFNKKAMQRFRMVASGSVEDTLNLAQVPEGSGGRMPIVTGFLHASIQAAIGSMPSGPKTNEGDIKYPVGSQVAGVPVAVVLLKWNPATEEILFAGWTAAYARRIEYGFMGQDSLGRTYNQTGRGYFRGAIEQWIPIVEANVAHARAMIP